MSQKIGIMVDIIEMRKIVLDPSFGRSHSFQIGKTASDIKTPEIEEEEEEEEKEGRKEEEREEKEEKEEDISNDNGFFEFSLFCLSPMVMDFDVQEWTRIGMAVNYRSCVGIHLLDDLHGYLGWFWWFASHRKRRGLSEFTNALT